MKADLLEAAKAVAIQVWDLEKQLMLVAPSVRDRNLLMDLVRLEDKPVDLRTGGEQWEIENILEKLAEKPPYRKQTRPYLTNPNQPIRAPQSEAERAFQMEPQVRAHLEALEGHLASMGLDKVPGIQFQVVDGYGPMVARQEAKAAQEAALIKAQAAALDRLNNPNPFVRFGRWVKRLFRPAQPGSEMETLEMEVAKVLLDSEKVLAEEYSKLTPDELRSHIKAAIKAQKD